MHPIMAQEIGRVRMQELHAEAARARLARQVRPARRSRGRRGLGVGRVLEALAAAFRLPSERRLAVRRAPATLPN